VQEPPAGPVSRGRLEPGCLDFHKTERPVLTGAWPVRQPIFDRSVGRWRSYEKHLGPLLEVLAQGDTPVLQAATETTFGDGAGVG
jgi:hypothetical protein